MAGPLTIQRVPKALTDLLGMRATGELPNTLSPDIGGSIELINAYLFDRMVYLRTNTASAIIGTGTLGFTGTQVPPGFVWFLHSYSVEMPALAAASSATVTPVISRYFNVRQVVADEKAFPASTAGCWGTTFEYPVLIGPGESFSLYISNMTGAPAVTPVGMFCYTPIGI